MVRTPYYPFLKIRRNILLSCGILPSVCPATIVHACFIFHANLITCSFPRNTPIILGASLSSFLQFVTRYQGQISSSTFPNYILFSGQETKFRVLHISRQSHNVFLSLEHPNNIRCLLKQFSPICHSLLGPNTLFNIPKLHSFFWARNKVSHIKEATWYKTLINYCGTFNRYPMLL